MSFASEAALSALLRYAPQKSALAELQQNAENTYRQSVQAGRSSGVLGVQAASRAIPEMRGVYNRAEKSANRAHELLAPTLEALGPKAQGYKTAAANERAYGQEAAARERAAGLNQLQQEKIAAAEGPQFTARAAGQALVNELAKILTREGSLSGQEGAYAAGEAEKLKNQAAKEAATERRDLRKEEGAERRNERTVQAAIEGHHLAHPGGPGAAPPQTSAAQAKASSSIASMMHSLQMSGVSGEKNRSLMVKYLTTERPEQSFKSGGQTVKVGKRSAYPAGPQMEAAIDQYLYGYINPNHGELLRRQGYNPKELGLVSEREWREQHPPSESAIGLSGGVKAGR